MILELSSSVGFAAASGNFQGSTLGQPGGYFRCHFHEPQTPSVAGRPVEGLDRLFQSLCLSGCQFVFHRQQPFRLCPVPWELRAPATQPACLEGASRQEEQPP